MNIEEHELFPKYRPEEGSELYMAMLIELEASAQHNAARLILQERVQELRVLMCRFKHFNSRTPVEDVMEAQAKAKALRWLIRRIEQEVAELREVKVEAARQVQAQLPQTNQTSNTGNGVVAPKASPAPSRVNGEQNAVALPVLSNLEI